MENRAWPVCFFHHCTEKLSNISQKYIKRLVALCQNFNLGQISLRSVKSNWIIGETTFFSSGLIFNGSVEALQFLQFSTKMIT